MMAAQAAILPVFIFFFDQAISSAWLGVLACLALGVLGLSAIGTLFAAIAVRTRAREVMLPLLMLPLVVPLFIGGVRTTARLFAGRPLADVAQWLNLMLAFDLLFLVVGWLVFAYAVEE
jgi:heme exporter protein B